MRRLPLLTISFFLLAILPAAASASVPHVVQPGETLWSIAAANNFTTRSLAAANGLSETSPVVLGSTIQIPSVAEGTAALQKAGIVPAPAAAPVAASAPKPMGGYIVRPGDTLSGLAARAGVSVQQMAFMNGLQPNAMLIAGSPLKLPTGAPVPTTAAAPSVVEAATPAPTPGRVSAADIATVAGRNGVPGSLASAIAWQESGFNNAMVSSANARGVMQVMPGTWTWVQKNLALRRLDPANPIDNVGAGVLYLGNLLKQTGGDPAMAAAAYYQGLGSVRRIGMLPETRRYVASVLALRSRFGG
jgi:soluble lytic murein transglycosylase-like protein